MQCSHETCYQMPRTVENGIVKASNRTVYRLCEDDILGVAGQKGIKLTEEQLDQVSRLVDKGIDPDGHWVEVIEMALEEINAKGKEM